MRFGSGYFRSVFMLPWGADAVWGRVWRRRLVRLARGKVQARTFGCACPFERPDYSTTVFFLKKGKGSTVHGEQWSTDEDFV
jgi:hypothetical protein